MMTRAQEKRCRINDPLVQKGTQTDSKMDFTEGLMDREGIRRTASSEERRSCRGCLCRRPSLYVLEIGCTGLFQPYNFAMGSASKISA